MHRPLSRRVVVVLAAVLIAAGTGLRFWQLDRMFAHIDDLFPIAGPYVMNQGAPRTVTVPYTHGQIQVTADTQTIKRNPLFYAAYVSTATYAPLQFTLYPLVLSGDYGYREFLFRGRLFSAVFGSLALVAFLWAYRAYAPALDAPALAGLAVLVFSLLNLTYAQQSISYAAGVLGATVLVGVIGRMAATTATRRRLAMWACLCAVLAYTNYQLAVLGALAYAALALTEARGRRTAEAVRVWARYAASGLLCALLLLPLAIPLHDKTAGVGQFKGLSGAEQFFPRFAGADVASRVWEAGAYAAQAAYRLVRTDVLFALDSPLGAAGVALLFVLVPVGLWSLARRGDAPARALAAFGAAVFVMLAVLNGAGRFPISPTRHVLVFLPLLALLISLGARHVRPVAIRDGGVMALVALMASVFAWEYPAFRAARTDPFDERSMAALIDRYGVDTIVGYGSTWHPALMFRTDPDRRVAFIDLDAIMRKHQSLDERLPRKPFLLVSHTLPVAEYPATYPDSGPRLELPGYRIEELIRREARVEIGISDAVKMGANGMYVSLAVPVDAGDDGESGAPL